MRYISLGYFCSVAIELERLGLRTESSPFDWVISNMEGVIRAIETDFEDFLTYEYLSQSKENAAHYKNEKYDIAFFHDFNKYIPLEQQLPEVRKKYDRRIQRFYDSIKEPTLFVRYISDQKMQDDKSIELTYIENNYDKIIRLIKSFNAENDILFIANEGVCSKKIQIYNVRKDKNDVVSRMPICKNEELFSMFSAFDTPNKQDNIRRYWEKEKSRKRISVRLKNFCVSKIKGAFREEYSHEKQY